MHSYLNSSADDLRDRFCASFSSLRENAGQDATVMLGVLLAAGVIFGFLTWLWILRGGLSASHHQFHSDRQVIEQYLREP